MRLLAATVALLGWRFAQAIPTFGELGSDPFIIEEATSSGHFVDPELQQRALRFYNQATAPFAVNGSALPSIAWDVGESYAGLLPITNNKDETRKLFFWFFPSYNPEPRDEIVVWLNGGPGCSSMEGLMTENGPINWLPGTDAPTPNPFTWLNLTNVVWIDQPLGVGYSQGEPDIETEEELAAQFIGFWKNFVKLFCMEEWRMYLTGESYAGVYIPYIAGAFINAGDPTYYNLVGVHMNAATIGDGNLQMNVALPSYAAHWNLIMGLNESFMADLEQRADECGLTQYIEEQLQFPPSTKLFNKLVWQNDTWAAEQCDMFPSIRTAAELVNPCFNVYHVTDSCPWPSSIIGSYSPYANHSQKPPTWFSQPSVRSALHVPSGRTGTSSWVRCTSEGVFRNRTDGSRTNAEAYSSPPASTNLLSRVIEYTGNVIIGSGALDMLIPTNGTLLVLQNVTWGGEQGFQKRPARPFFSPYPIDSTPVAASMAGIVGTWGRERGLTFYEVALGGHELPRYAPGPTFRAMELLLGRISSLGDTGSFTTQTLEAIDACDSTAYDSAGS